MYAESTRPSAKRDVQKFRSAKRDDRIACPRRAQTCELRAERAMRMCPRSGRIFFIEISWTYFEQNDISKSRLGENRVRYARRNLLFAYPPGYFVIFNVGSRVFR